MLEGIYKIKFRFVTRQFSFEEVSSLQQQCQRVFLPGLNITQNMPQQQNWQKETFITHCYKQYLINVNLDIGQDIMAL